MRTCVPIKPANTIETCSLGTRVLKKTAKNDTSLQNENTCFDKNQRRRYKLVTWEQMLRNKPVKNDMRTEAQKNPEIKRYENRGSEKTEENDMSTERPKAPQKKTI